MVLVELGKNIPVVFHEGFVICTETGEKRDKKKENKQGVCTEGSHLLNTNNDFEMSIFSSKM